MGYMGLETYADSDNAADFHCMLNKSLPKNVGNAVKLFNEELKNKANCYNTPGFVNVALVVEGGVLDNLSKLHKKKFVVAISKARDTLDEEINENKDSTEQNVVWHMNAYKRMSDSLSKWIKENTNA